MNGASDADGVWPVVVGHARRIPVVILATAMLLVGLAGSASARTSSPQSVLAELVREGAPGVVALVRHDGRARAFAAGVADVKLRRPMRTALRFRVGSVSKSVVATLILKLVAERRIRLSDTVSHWLPGLIPTGSRITIRELLQHRSGLFDFTASPEWFAPYLAGQRPLSYVWTPRQLVRLATGHPLDFSAGARFEYSSTNYIVLGLIVERATRLSLERYAERTLFGPLRMRSTSFAVGHVPGAHAHGYVPFGAPFPAVGGGLGDAEPLNGSGSWAAGALVSTAADLDRFFRGLFTGRVIPHSLVALMQAARPTKAGPSHPPLYGLGLEEQRYGCGTAWGHTGDIFGYSTVVRASRDARRLVVLLINRDFPPPALTVGENAALPALYCGR